MIVINNQIISPSKEKYLEYNVFEYLPNHENKISRLFISLNNQLQTHF